MQPSPIAKASNPYTKPQARHPGSLLKGYANGGSIEGPGTPTSDSIPAKVQQTGEPIQVANGERIVSADQDALLLRIAKAMGHKSVDEMFQAGTGKPVGPTVKYSKGKAVKGAAGGYNPAADSQAFNVAASTEDAMGYLPGENPMQRAGRKITSGFRAMNLDPNKAPPVQPVTPYQAPAVAGDTGNTVNPVVPTTSTVKPAATTPVATPPATAPAAPAPVAAPSPIVAPQANNAEGVAQVRAAFGNKPMAGEPAYANMNSGNGQGGAADANNFGMAQKSSSVRSAYNDSQKTLGTGVTAGLDAKGKLLLSNPGPSTQTWIGVDGKPTTTYANSAQHAQGVTDAASVKRIGDSMERTRLQQEAASSNPSYAKPAQIRLAEMDKGTLLKNSTAVTDSTLAVNAANVEGTKAATQGALTKNKAADQQQALMEELGNPATTPDRRELIHKILIAGKTEANAWKIIPGHTDPTDPAKSTPPYALSPSGQIMDVQTAVKEQSAKSAPPTLSVFKAHVMAKNPGVQLTDAQILDAYKKQFPGAK